ncbi:MAG TPA: hypothetical protein VGM15_03185 [Burkholderiaceae bacterium]|jgi:hypothetical protein
MDDDPNEDSFPLEIPGRVLRRAADVSFAYKVGKLADAVQHLDERFGAFERAEEKSDARIGALEKQVQRWIGALGVLAVLLTVLIAGFESGLLGHLH